MSVAHVLVDLGPVVLDVFNRAGRPGVGGSTIVHDSSATLARVGGVEVVVGTEVVAELMGDDLGGLGSSEEVFVDADLVAIGVVSAHDAHVGDSHDTILLDFVLAEESVEICVGITSGELSDVGDVVVSPPFDARVVDGVANNLWNRC